MKNRSFRKGLTTVSLLVTSLSASPAFAGSYANQSEGYYKQNQYHNDRYGDFPPADIDEKLSAHINTGAVEETAKQAPANPQVPANRNPPVSTANPQVANPAQGYPLQNSQQPAYGNYYQGRNYAPYGNQGYNRGYNRNTNFNGPWNNNRSNFSGPWNNNGSSFSGPWNNNRSGFGGPWDNNSTNFSGPWNNNGSSSSMPWGNNNGSGSGFNPMGNGGSWGW